MQVSTARAITDYDPRTAAPADAPFAPGVCLLIWGAIASVGWGFVGAVAAIIG
jgi:hypothetical protein